MSKIKDCGVGGGVGAPGGGISESVPVGAAHLRGLELVLQHERRGLQRLRRARLAPLGEQVEGGELPVEPLRHEHRAHVHAAVHLRGRRRHDAGQALDS